VPTSLDDLPRATNGLPRPFHSVGPQGGPGTTEPGQLICTHCSLERLIGVAYEKSPPAIAVLNWMSYELYDLIAKIPSGSTEHDVHLMLQQLLNERFHLEVHHESGELPGFVIVAGKRPPKLQAFAGGELASATVPQGPLLHPYLEDCLLKVGAEGNTMSELADLLSREVGSPVADQTGLQGRYNFSIAWFPIARMASEGRCAPRHVTAGRDALDAVKKQLGLRVESRKVPGDAVIVDSALKVPTGN
jgi:uncharacterized protein (TIGR03435 family)